MFLVEDLVNEPANVLTPTGVSNIANIKQQIYKL